MSYAYVAKYMHGGMAVSALAYKADCQDNFCKSQGHTSGTYCDGSGPASKSITCSEAGGCPLVKNIETCPNGCLDGTCQGGSVCTDDCAKGQTQCVGDSVQQCGQFDQDACLDWGAPVSCPGGCQSGKCIGPVVCGNGKIEGGEACEGSDFGGQTCLSQGFSAGQLACAACQISTAGCCKNECPSAGVKACANGAEQTCQATPQGCFKWSVPTNCQYGCSGQQCKMVSCGNGQIEAGEQCDGSNLGGDSCQAHGYQGGSLKCSNCTADTTSCCYDQCPSAGTTQCSNGSQQTCSAGPSGCLVWGVGVPCSNGCGGLSCAMCGDNVAEGSETCDGSDLKGQTCQSQGYGGGQLQCASCQGFDTSGCCSNGCSPGQTQCAGSSTVQNCVQQGGCYGWQTTQTCSGSQTCQNGQCVTTCSNPCSPGQTQCQGSTTVQSCVQQGSCYGWQSSSCGGGQTCQNGQCAASCSYSAYTKTEDYTTGGGIVLNVSGSLDASGNLSVGAAKIDGSTFGAGDYYLWVFDPNDGVPSSHCKQFNAQKGHITVSSSGQQSINFPSFPSLLTCNGSAKGYCVTKAAGGDKAWFGSHELVATYQ
jgi:hypothetical protein